MDGSDGGCGVGVGGSVVGVVAPQSAMARTAMTSSAAVRSSLDCVAVRPVSRAMMLRRC